MPFFILCRPTLTAPQCRAKLRAMSDQKKEQILNEILGTPHHSGGELLFYCPKCLPLALWGTQPQGVRDSRYCGKALRYRTWRRSQHHDAKGWRVCAAPSGIKGNLVIRLRMAEFCSPSGIGVVKGYEDMLTLIHITYIL